MDIKKKFTIGQEITEVNPVSGKLETGRVTAYAYNNIPVRKGPSGIFVKFPANRHPVELDGAFL